MLGNPELCSCPTVKRYPQVQGNVLSMDNSMVITWVAQFLKNSSSSSSLAKQSQKYLKAAPVQKTRFGAGEMVQLATCLPGNHKVFDL